MTTAAAVTVGALRSSAAVTLARAGVDTPELDAEVLLAYAGGWSRTALLARLRDPLPEAIAGDFAMALARRCRREPLAYITGEKEFWSLGFAVDRGVLVPRPETELLVEVVSQHVRERAAAVVCDVGTGSGCIAVALAHAHPALRVVAVDVSPAALRVARANVARHGVGERVQVVESDLFSALPAELRFDVIAANPPYVGEGERLAAELDWEPRLALRAGPAGLDIIERLLAAAPARLTPGGLLAIEIGAGQAEAVLDLAARAGLAGAAVHEDLAGLPRLLVAENPAP